MQSPMHPAAIPALPTLTEPGGVRLWLASVYRRSGSDRTIEAYTAALDRYRAWWQRPLAEATLRDAVAYGAHLQASGLSASSQAQALAAVRACYRFLGRLGYVDRSPFDALPSPRVSTEGAPRMVSTDDVRAMLAVATLRERAVILLLATTGLRVSEALGATWADVYRDPGGNVGLSVVGKGGKVRMVKLLPAVLEALRAVGGSKVATTAVSAALGRPGGTGGQSEYLLPMRSRQAVDAMLARLAKRAGVRHLSAHWLRHFAATTALAQGAPLLQVQHDLGHAALSTTQRYLHAAEGLQRTSADFIATILEG